MCYKKDERGEVCCAKGKDASMATVRELVGRLEEAAGKRFGLADVAPHVEKFKQKFASKGWDIVETKVSAKGGEVTMRFGIDAARAFVVRLRPTGEPGRLEGDVRLMDYDKALSTAEFEVSDLAHTQHPLSLVPVPRADGR